MQPPDYDLNKIKFATDDIVSVLEAYAKLDSTCIKAFGKLEGKETCFGWEKPLMTLVSYEKN